MILWDFFPLPLCEKIANPHPPPRPVAEGGGGGGGGGSGSLSTTSSLRGGEGFWPLAPRQHPPPAGCHGNDAISQVVQLFDSVITQFLNPGILSLHLIHVTACSTAGSGSTFFSLSCYPNYEKYN